MRIQIATVQQLKPGQMSSISVNDHSILLANVDGHYYACEDRCSHEDWPLSNGALKGHCVECPLHGSRFNLQTGAPLEPPATTPVKTYPVTIIEHAVFIDI